MARYLAQILPFLLGLVLVAAAIAKAREPQEATAALAQFVSLSQAKSIVVTLIFAEAIVGALLLTGLAPRLTLALSAFMFATFVIYSLLLWSSNSTIGCGCGLTFLPFLNRSDPLSVFLRAITGFVLCVVAMFATKSVSRLQEERIGAHEVSP